MFSGAHLIIKGFVIWGGQGGRMRRRDHLGCLKWVELVRKWVQEVTLELSFEVEK